MSNWKVEISPFTKKESLEFTDQFGNKVTIHNMSSSTLELLFLTNMITSTVELVSIEIKLNQ